MSEPVAKERPPVDYDAYERRFGSPDHHEDPLAELARLVGEHHDPYQDVFADEAMAQHAPAAQHGYDARREPAFGAAPPVSPRLKVDFAAIEAGLRGSLPSEPEAPAYAGSAEHEFYAQHAEYPQDEQAYLQDHEDQQWAAEPRQRPAVSRGRRPIYAMAATIAVGVIGVGVAFAYKGTSSSPREIKTIMAAAGPTKIQPPADASNDQANQDAAILGKNGQAAPTQTVSREEQPVDLSAAVQENTSRDADAGAGSQGDASSVAVPPSPSQTADGTSTGANGMPSVDPMASFGMEGMPAPKRVKVVSVRPDGTILPNDEPPAAALPTPRSAQMADRAAPVAKASTPRSGATPKTTSRIAQKPIKLAKADPAPAGNADDADAAPAPKPTKKTKHERVASAETTATDADTTASVSSSGGGFAVQLAAPGSEADAKSASSRLAKKFADALSGRRLGFHKAQSNGKSVYRVRVGSLSKDEAVSLCEKLKADGGSCFVAKN